MKSKKIVSLILIVGALLTAQPTLAKGGNDTRTPSPTLPNIITTAGPCDLDNSHNNIIIETETTREVNVELVHPNYPGGAVVHFVRDKATQLLYVSTVCLDEGWAVSKYKMAGSWGSEQGIDITVSYNGVDAVRYRMLSQGIRQDIY